MKLRMKPPSSRTSLDLQRQILLVPEHVVIGVGRPVNGVSSLFDYSIEFVLNEMIDAIGDRIMAPQRLNRTMRHLGPVIADVPVTHHHGLIDRMVAIEQAALDISDYLNEMKLYLYGRYLPYQFETLMNDGSILLKRVRDYQEFSDRVALELGFDEGE